jgi:O-antigen ligase
MYPIQNGASVPRADYRLDAPNAQNRMGRDRVAGPIPIPLSLSFLLFVFTIPLEIVNVSLDLGPISLSRFTGFLFFAVSLLYSKRCYSDRPSAIYWFLGYLAVSVAVGVSGSSGGYALSASVLTFIQLFVFFLIASNLLKNANYTKLVLLVYAIGVAVLALAIRFGLFGLSPITGDRLTVAGYNQNNLGMILSVAVVLFLGFVLDRNSKVPAIKAVLLVLAMVVLESMIKTGSRTAFAIMIIGLSCYAWPSALTRKRKILMIVMISLALLSAGYMLISDTGFASRWQSTISEGDSSGRDVIYAVAYGMFLERPIFGWGAGTGVAELAGRLNEGAERAVHNMILGLLLEVGIFGSIFFLAGLWLCGRSAWRSRKGVLGTMPLALFLMVFVFQQSQPYLETKTFWLILSLSIGLAKGIQSPGANRQAVSRLAPVRRDGQFQSLQHSRSSALRTLR